jgi:hypothetical protein
MINVTINADKCRSLTGHERFRSADQGVVQISLSALEMSPKGIHRCHRLGVQVILVETCDELLSAELKSVNVVRRLSGMSPMFSQQLKLM